MKKYVLQALLIFFLVIVGVGIINDINAKSLNDETISSFEEKIENGEEIEDGNLLEVRVEKEDTSNLISRTSAFFAKLVVETLNFGFKIIINLMNGMTN
jgi:hypothetical protein